MKIVKGRSWCRTIGLGGLACVVLVINARVSVGEALAAEQGKVGRLSTRELAGCLRSDANCGIEDWVIREEMSRRKDVATITALYSASSDETQKDRLVEVLFEVDDPEVSRFMRTLMTTDVSLRDYYAAQYLARRGDHLALSIMNRNHFKYPVSSAAWASTIRLFGKYRYRPAISNLIESIDAASVNVAAAAVASLQLLFPGSPPEFKSPTDAKKYFKERARRQVSGL